MSNNINKINKQIKLWIEIIAVIFFALSVITHIFLQSYPLFFYISLLVLIILLLSILILTEKLLKINRHEIEHLEKSFDKEKKELVEKNLELSNRLLLIEENENKRKGNLSKEEEIAVLLNEFYKDRSNAHKLLTFISEAFQAVGAILYIQSKPGEDFIVEDTFGLPDDFEPSSFALGEGLNGQAALDEKPVLVETIPDDYFNAVSGLGNSKPKYLYLIPIINKGSYNALIELASFEKNDLVIQLTVEN